MLRYGEAVPARVRERRKRWNEGIGYQEREIFELFLKLPVPQRKVVREVIVALALANGYRRTARMGAVSQATEGYRHGLDFSAALHLALSAACESLATFDAGFGKKSGRLGVKPVIATP